MERTKKLNFWLAGTTLFMAASMMVTGAAAAGTMVGQAPGADAAGVEDFLTPAPAQGDWYPPDMQPFLDFLCELDIHPQPWFCSDGGAPMSSNGPGHVTCFGKDHTTVLTVGGTVHVSASEKANALRVHQDDGDGRFTCKDVRHDDPEVSFSVANRYVSLVMKATCPTAREGCLHEVDAAATKTTLALLQIVMDDPNVGGGFSGIPPWLQWLGCGLGIAVVVVGAFTGNPVAIGAGGGLVASLCTQSDS